MGTVLTSHKALINRFLKKVFLFKLFFEKWFVYMANKNFTVQNSLKVESKFSITSEAQSFS